METYFSRTFMSLITLLVSINAYSSKYQEYLTIKVYIQTQPKSANYVGTTAKATQTNWDQGGCNDKAWKPTVNPSSVTTPNASKQTKSNLIQYSVQCNYGGLQGAGTFGLSNATISINDTTGAQVATCYITYTIQQYFNEVSTGGGGTTIIPVYKVGENLYQCNVYNSSVNGEVGISYHNKGNYYSIWQNLPTSKRRR